MKNRMMLSTLLFGALLGSAHATPPQGWFIAGNAPADYDFGTDAQIAHGGSKSGYIRARNVSSVGFGTLMQTLSSTTYRGKRVRLSAYLRSRDVGKAQMWMRIDVVGNKIAGFDNMDSRPIRGNTDWKRYDIVLDVPNDTADIAFGFLLDGVGEVWGDSFTLEAVGNEVPVTGAAHPQLPDAPKNIGFEDLSLPCSRSCTSTG